MAQLDGGSRALAVHVVGQLAEFGHDFGPHPQLALEREAALGDGGIGYGRHAHAPGGYGMVIVHQLPGRPVARTHALEGGRADGPVAERQRTYFYRCEQHGM